MLMKDRGRGLLLPGEGASDDVLSAPLGPNQRLFDGSCEKRLPTSVSCTSRPYEIPALLSRSRIRKFSPSPVRGNPVGLAAW